jgi:hypothetical protein
MLFGGRKGKTKGCKMTFGVDDIYISDGCFMASNRLVEITSKETIATPVVSSGTTYFRLVYEIDLAQSNTTDDFKQGYFKVLSASGDYPVLRQEDLDNGGSVYQLPFARFTKTISGISNFVSELESIGYAPDNMTVYVSTSGNDASGDGTESYPYRTIQKAINSLPKNLNDKEITINVASGTYSEAVLVSGFYGGILRFAFGTVTVKTFSVYDCGVILAGTSLALSANGETYGFYVHRGANVICQLPLTINGASNGLFVSYGSRFSGRSTVTCNSCTYAASASNAAHLYIITLGGSKNNNAIQASSGMVSIGSIDSAMASTLYVTINGGRIYTGAQSSVPAY